MRFSLENRQEIWDNCFLSIYVYETTGLFNESMGWMIYAYETGWTEDDLYGGGDYLWHSEYYNLILTKGLNLININVLMLDSLTYANNTMTIFLYPYLKNEVWSAIDKMAYIYSREANINDIFKPQLIWSD